MSRPWKANQDVAWREGCIIGACVGYFPELKRIHRQPGFAWKILEHWDTEQTSKNGPWVVFVDKELLVLQLVHDVQAILSQLTITVVIEESYHVA
jgi:hypothetical protein